MALLAKVGRFTSSTGTYSITGVGFQPKVILFYGNFESADGATAGEGWMYFGAATSASNRFYTGFATRSFVGNFSHRGYDETEAYGLYDTHTGVYLSFDLVSFDPDGFTLSQTVTPATAKEVCYLALAGPTLQSVSTTGSGNVPNSQLNFTVTYGFIPDCTLMFSNMIVSTATSATDVESYMSIGAAAPMLTTVVSQNTRLISGYANNTNPTVDKTISRIASLIDLGKVKSTLQ